MPNFKIKDFTIVNHYKDKPVNFYKSEFSCSQGYLMKLSSNFSEVPMKKFIIGPQILLHTVTGT